MKIATFNINGVNKRLANLLGWLGESAPDVVCLQELKAADTAFPRAAIAETGYGAAWLGESSWNGVAILARGADPIVTQLGLPGDPDDRQSRYIEAAVGGVLVASLYLPNGNPQPGPKFAYKLAWFERLLAHVATLIEAGVPAVLAGDYNVVPTDADIYSTRSWKKNALLQPAGRARPMRPGCWRKAGPTRSAPPIRTSRSSPSGTISATTGPATPACGSTICCSARAWPTGCRPPASTDRSAASRAPAITRRPGSSLVSRRGLGWAPALPPALVARPSSDGVVSATAPLLPSREKGGRWARAPPGPPPLSGRRASI